MSSELRPRPPECRISAWAIVALITGLFCLPVLPLILGIVARRKVAKSGGMLKGGLAADIAILIGACQIIYFVAMRPMLRRAKMSADLTTATSSMRCSSIFLFAFEDDWGCFPCERIREDNPERFKGARPGHSANAMLSILHAGGYTNSEEVFWTPDGSWWNPRPDNEISGPEEVLKPGECGLGYVMLKGRAQTAEDPGGRPVMVARLKEGQGERGAIVDHEVYGGRGVYIRIDQSVKQGPVNESGEMLMPGGQHLFQTGRDTMWGTDVPEVRAPE
jgi:hypothetical protein